MTDLSQDREKDKINPVVFYTSAGLILLFSLTTIFFRDFSAEWIGRTLNWVSKTFGWYYLLAATLYIVFVVCIACSRFGSVKLGPEQSKPEFSLLSWAAMLFAAGIGIDLMSSPWRNRSRSICSRRKGQGRRWRLRARRWSGRCSTTA